MHRASRPRPRSRAVPRAACIRRGRATSRSLDQRALPHAVVSVKIARRRRGGARDSHDVGARRAADRRRRRVRTRARARSRRVRRERSRKAHAALDATRPTAVNLRWALDRVRDAVRRRSLRSARADAAWREADAIAAEDVAINHAIGEHGLALLRAIARATLRARAGDDALQRRRARDVRLGHGDGAALPRARRRPGAARLGERDAAAAAGRQSHGLGARAARRAAHAVRRRRGRAADAAAAMSTS